MTFERGAGAAQSGREVSKQSRSPRTRDLDQLFLLHAAALETGEALWQWWFGWRAQAQDATTQESLESVLRDSLTGIAHALGADAMAVLLADDSGGLVMRAAIGIQPELWQEVHIASGAGMAGRVLAQRRPFVVPDLARIEVASQTLRDSGVRSLVAVPVLGQHRVIGVLHADSFELAHFGDRDVPLLALVADRIGAAIEQVRLFESEREARARAEASAARLERLQRVTAALSKDQTAEEVAGAVLTELSEDIDGDAVSHLIWVVEGERLRLLRPAQASPAADAFTDLSVDDPLPGPAVVRSGEPMWFSSRAEIESFEALKNVELGAEALALLPLRLGDEVLGVLSVAYGRPRSFGEDERQFFSVVSAQVAVSLQRAAVRLARVRVARDNALLADVSAALGSSLDSVTTLQRALAELVPRLADLATFHLFDDHGTPRRICQVHRDPETDAFLAKLPLDGAHEVQSVLNVAAAAGRRPMLVPAGGDLAREWALDDEQAEQLRRLEVASGIAVPLMSRGELLGLLGLLRLTGSDPYTEADLDLAAEVGARASIAVDNALQAEKRVALARALQASLLPPALGEVPGAEVAAVFHAAGTGAEVGGDFYDLFPVDSGRWVLMIGDVSGSGPAAAVLTAQVRHGARVAARAGLEPAAVVGAVNATLDETTGSEWFCTMVYAEIVPGDDGVDLQVISAGHVPPLVTAGGEVHELDCQSPLMGVLPGAVYTARPVRLAPGQALLLVTDGATEARPIDDHGPATFFGEQRLRQAVASAAGRDARALVETVAEAVLEYAGGRLDDDLVLVALRAAPADNRAKSVDQNLDQ
jgi:serine phosphatase RsbU (regulator of sigma subunit)